MNVVGYALILVLVVAALGAYAVLPIVMSDSSTGTLSTSGTSTASTSCSIGTSTQVTSTTLSGTYTVSGSKVRVDNVSATVFTDQSGQKTLRVEVGFTNVGNSSIYVPVGCASSLNSTITSGSGIVRTVNGAPRCLCAEALSAIAPGQSRSEVDPGCWSGYYYQVVGSGTISVKLVLGWFPSSQFNNPASYITINSNFTIP